MKLVFSFLFSFGFYQTYAQQKFEGTIVYKVAAPDEDTATLKVQFGKNALSIDFQRRGPGGKEQVLVDLESGKTFELDMGMKTYAVKKMFSRTRPREAGSSGKIAGYDVTAIDLSEKGIAALVANMNRGQVLIYPSNDLYYPVPEQYISNIALSMVYDNKIILGLSLIDHNGRVDGKMDTIRIMASSVVPEVFPENHFNIPEGFFTEQEAMMPPPPPVYIESGTDSVTYPVPPPPAWPPVAPEKKNTKKKANTTDKPMRKPGKN